MNELDREILIEAVDVLVGRQDEESKKAKEALLKVIKETK